MTSFNTTCQLTLNKYQRDNLLWLLDVVRSIEPFTLANTGDWVAEIAFKLSDTGSLTLADVPNFSLKGLKNSISEWLRTQPIVCKARNFQSTLKLSFKNSTKAMAMLWLLSLESDQKQLYDTILQFLKEE